MVQQNLFNLTSNNSAFKRVVPRQGVLLFTSKNPSSMKQADLRDMFKNVSKSICILTDPLSLILSPSSAVMMPENTQEDPDDHKPADKGGIQIVHSILYLNVSSLVWFF